MIRIIIIAVLATSIHLKIHSQPFLYFDNDRLAQIKSAVLIQDSHHWQAFQGLKRRVGSKDLNVYGNDINQYTRAYLAQETAFLSLLSDQTSDQKKYALEAFDVVKNIYENPQQERLPHKGYGLSRAMMQLGLALPYAWCRQYWNKEQKNYVALKIDEALDAWLTYNHANFGNERGSNWVAVCRGGELTLIIAANQETKRKERYNYLVEQLMLHMKNGYGSLGASQEGMGYTEYGATFLLKAVYATASIGDSTLFEEAQKHDWWQLAMYAESFQSFSRKFLMTGVAGSGAYNEGFASLLLNLVPATQLPYYTWWYDRHMGVKAPYPADEKFDNHRAGTIWSILYYPLQTIALDPTGVFPAAVADDHGYYFFRNRWKDENDIMLSLMADSHHHGNAWDQPEVFCLNLMGYNTRFFGGPGKDRANELYSTLLVNDQYNIDHAVKLTGKTNHWEVEENTAYLVVDGHELYKTLGAAFAQRHLAIKFLSDNQLLLVMLDTLMDEEENKYTWQGNLGDNNGSDSLRLAIIPDSIAPVQIKVSGRNKSELQGWFFNEKVEVENTGDPLRISFSGKNPSLLSIFWLGQQVKPSLERKSVESEIHYIIEGQTIIYDWLNNKIRIK